MADRKFTLFHLNLIPVQQKAFDTLNISREDWIRLVLSKPLELPHFGGKQLHWVPKGERDGDIFGVLQMQRPLTHHQPPDAGGDEVVSPVWHGAFVLIDPTHHDAGQRVAIENDVVGKPYALLKSLISYTNTVRNDKPYEIYISQLFEEQNFWDFSERHDGVLKYITFEFIVPNMFNPDGNFDEEIKETGKDTNAEVIRTSFLGKNGVLANSNRVRQAVKYISRHAGRILAKSPDGETYSSDDKEKTTQVPKLEVEGEGEIDYLASQKSKVFGHEQSENDNALDLSGGSDGVSGVD